MDPALDVLWKRVLDHWEEDAPHAALLEYCRETDQLAEAAARYRGMAGDRDRGPVAARRLQGIAFLALARLEATRTPPPRQREIGKLLLIVLFVAASVALLWYLLTT